MSLLHSFTSSARRIRNSRFMFHVTTPPVWLPLPLSCFITTKLHSSQASYALHPVTAIQHHAPHSKPANFTKHSTWITDLHHGSYQNTLHHMTHITNHSHKSQLTSHSSQSHERKKTRYILVVREIKKSVTVTLFSC